MHGVKIKECKIIETKDHGDKVNGQVREIVNILEPFMKKTPVIEQAYITICYPGHTKGLHVHRKKEDRFCVIRGTAEIALYTPGEIEKITLGYPILKVIIIPPGIGHGIKCIGNEACWILNCPSKAYDKDIPDQIEIPVEW